MHDARNDQFACKSWMKSSELLVTMCATILCRIYSVHKSSRASQKPEIRELTALIRWCPGSKSRISRRMAVLYETKQSRNQNAPETRVAGGSTFWVSWTNLQGSAVEWNTIAGSILPIWSILRHDIGRAFQEAWANWELQSFREVFSATNKYSCRFRPMSGQIFTLDQDSLFDVLIDLGHDAQLKRIHDVGKLCEERCGWNGMEIISLSC